MNLQETAHAIHEAARRLQQVVRRTPLMRHEGLSQRYGCSVWLKREDLQVVRSYKLRGAYNLMSTLTPEQMQRGVVWASAGNHAQGFAQSCRKLGLHGIVFMPVITPRQKVSNPDVWAGKHKAIEMGMQLETIGDFIDEATDDEKYKILHVLCDVVYYDFGQKRLTRFEPHVDFVPIFRLAAPLSGWDEKEGFVFSTNV